MSSFLSTSNLKGIKIVAVDWPQPLICLRREALFSLLPSVPSSSPHSLPFPPCLISPIRFFSLSPSPHSFPFFHPHIHSPFAHPPFLHLLIHYPLSYPPIHSHLFHPAVHSSFPHPPIHSFPLPPPTRGCVTRPDERSRAFARANYRSTGGRKCNGSTRRPITYVD